MFAFYVTFYDWEKRPTRSLLIKLRRREDLDRVIQFESPDECCAAWVEADV